MLILHNSAQSLEDPAQLVDEVNILRMLSHYAVLQFKARRDVMILLGAVISPLVRIATNPRRSYTSSPSGCTAGNSLTGASDVLL